MSIKRRPMAYLSALLLSLAGCGDATPSDSPALAGPMTLRLQPSVVNVVENGGRFPIQATVLDARGAVVLPAPPVAFAVRDTAVAAVDAQGLVTGRRYGTTWVYGRVSALTGASTDSVAVSVGRFSGT